MELKNLEDYRKFVELNRKLGVKSFKIGDISGELIQEALLPKTPYQLKKQEEEMKKSLEESHTNSILEAERALLWSSSVAEEGAN